MIVRTAAAVALLASTALATPQYERRIEVTQPGPQRLDVDLDLLAGSAPGLADLRIYDRGGREVPYLLIGPSTGEAEWIRTRRFQIAPTKTTSGIEVDAGGRRIIDALRIDDVAAPFLKRVRIEGSGDRHRWVLLADTTVFDLPAEGLERKQVEIAPSEIRYLRLTWDDSSSARIAGVPRVRVRVHGSAVPPAPLRAELPVQKRSSERLRSRYRILLPAAELPVSAVDFAIGGGDVFRQVTITEPRLAGTEIVPVTLGAGELKQAQRGELVASSTRIPISPPRSRELDIVIEDGSNDPLQITRATVELTPQPWIYFEAATAGPLIARYGVATLDAPKYDLEAARSFVAQRKVASAAWQEPKAVAATPRGAITIPLPALGAPVERSDFAIARRIALAPRGLSVLPLDADVLARSRDLADVRLIDGAGRQVPFIIEHRNEPLAVALELGAPDTDDGNVSRYAFTLPYDRLPSGTRLVLTTRAGVFERDVTLLDHSEEERDPRVIASATWRHADPDQEPPSLTVNLPRQMSRAAELRVEEGDNAPLPLESAQLVLPSFALRFHHPGTPLTLVYGNPRASAPRYDLALLAPQIFREPAQQVSFAAGAIPPGRSDLVTGRRFFWIAIALVALVLMLVLARLLRPIADDATPRG